ncbi:hypothetical protein [Candidatus Pyrohabitans sp.]
MDRKMKLAYAGLMVLLMVGASVGTVVAESSNFYLGLSYYASKNGASPEATALIGLVGVYQSAIWSYALATAGFSAGTTVLAATGISL